MQANHRPKLVIYFCLSVDKSLYKSLCIFPQPLGVLVWDVPAFIPRCCGVCATLLLRRELRTGFGSSWVSWGPNQRFFHSHFTPFHSSGMAGAMLTPAHCGAHGTPCLWMQSRFQWSSQGVPARHGSEQREPAGRQHSVPRGFSAFTSFY